MDSEEVRGLEASWQLLRLAIAADLMEKLPELVPLAAVPCLLNVSTAQVDDAVNSGLITVVLDHGVPCMLIAESISFFARATSVRLPLPEHLRPESSSRPVIGSVRHMSPRGRGCRGVPGSFRRAP